MPADTLTSNAASQEAVTQGNVEVPETTVDETSSQLEQQTEEQQLPLTPEQIELINQIADQRAMRIAQSQVAKGEHRIHGFIQSEFAKLDSMKDRLHLSPEQVKAAKDDIIAEAYSSQEGQPQENMQTNQRQSNEVDETDAQIQFMNAAIQDVFQQAGAVIGSSDPEYAKLQKVIDEVWSTPNGYTAQGHTKLLLAAQKLAQEKATRVAALSKNASARVVGSGKGSSGAASMTTEQIKADVANRRARGEKV